MPAAIGRFFNRIARPVEVEGVPYWYPGVRCSVYSHSGEGAFQCSRDEGHTGAHVNRAERGRGAIAWAPWAGEKR